MPIRNCCVSALLASLLCQAQPSLRVGISDLTKTVIYHSPQTPGYTSWVGCWLMPGGKP